MSANITAEIRFYEYITEQDEQGAESQRPVEAKEEPNGAAVYVHITYHLTGEVDCILEREFEYASIGQELAQSMACDYAQELTDFAELAENGASITREN